MAEVIKGGTPSFGASGLTFANAQPLTTSKCEEESFYGHKALVSITMLEEGVSPVITQLTFVSFVTG